MNPGRHPGTTGSVLTCALLGPLPLASFGMTPATDRPATQTATSLAAEAVHDSVPGRGAMVRVGTAEWHVWEGGTGPETVFLHGGGSLGQVWTGAFPLLARSCHLWVPDLPGFGLSPEEPALERLEDVVEALELFLTVVAAGPVILIGNSLGGMLAANLALAHPSRVSRLVLVAPPGGDPHEGPMDPDQEFPPGDVNARLYSNVRRALPHLPHLSAAESAARWRSARATTRRWYAGGWPPTRWEALDLPTLLVWGEEDRVVPVKSARGIMRRLPSARLVTLPGVGHVPQVEAPEEFVAAVQGFLNGEDGG